jgi:uncharacterized protein (TIGR02646 family)
MHHVNRGPEPKELKTIRVKYTQRWVNYYRKGKGKKPTDSHWLKFQPELAKRFFDLCGYCEEICHGQVDYFRPKSKFPERVYRWSNWVFACHNCNHAKGDEWQQNGYVDPCSRSVAERSENFFDFDTTTGEILPKKGLTKAKREKAQRTIDDLGLNDQSQIKRRRERIEFVSLFLSVYNASDPEHEEFMAHITARHTRLSSITRALRAERGDS